MAHCMYSSGTLCLLDSTRECLGEIYTVYQEVLTLLVLTVVSLYLYSFYDCFY